MLIKNKNMLIYPYISPHSKWSATNVWKVPCHITLCVIVWRVTYPKGNWLNNKYGFFFYQPVVCLFVVCVCVLGMVYVVFRCKTLRKSHKSTHQHTTLHQCNIIALLLRSSKKALSDCTTTVHSTALHCLLDSICCKSLKIFS